MPDKGDMRWSTKGEVDRWALLMQPPESTQECENDLEMEFSVEGEGEHTGMG